jgi:hypothetical protein
MGWRANGPKWRLLKHLARTMHRFWTVTGLALAVASIGAACGGDNATTAGDDGGIDDGAQCPPCVTDEDCNGGICAQLGGDAYCAQACPNGYECSRDAMCTGVKSVGGQRVEVCVPRGGSCGASDDGGARDSGVHYDGGDTVTSNIGANGGTESRLYFAVVGDTRPPRTDDTAGYPTAIITKIYKDITGTSPMPPFVLSTGDYCFASTYGSEAAAQIDIYMQARAKYSGAWFPAMGNHECTGATDSNCGPGSQDGTTNNYKAFFAKMLGPIQKTDPYYEIEVDEPNKAWTAKFLFVAANAWSSAQATWLDKAMRKNTTYTFVVRHEGASANTAPGVNPAEGIMTHHPYTLSIVGHAHTYAHYRPREVTIGNGGAPLSGSKNYGYGMFSQRGDGAIQVDMIDYSSGLSDSSFRFAVRADGSPAP